MSEFTCERAIVVAAHSDQFGAPAEFIERLFDPFALRLARPGRMHEIAQKNDLVRVHVVAKREQFIASSEVRQWTQLTTTALRPGVPEVNIGEHGCVSCGYIERAGGVRAQSR
jgi:hypothetical protein